MSESHNKKEDAAAMEGFSQMKLDTALCLEINDEHEESNELNVALIAEDYLERLRNGEEISIAEFSADYPSYTRELNELLPTMMSLEGLCQSSRQQAAPEIQFPERLGAYKLIEKIGRGGVGTVYRAMQDRLNREVAIKILSPVWSSEDGHCEAFENESRLIAQLRHTNIVEIYGAGQEGEFRYYVMSLVNGKGLTENAIRKAYSKMPYRRALAELAYQAACALSFAHANGILHRDVKPGNLLLDKSGRLHVSDFGLATMLNAHENASLVTQSNDGTLHYMAPERLMHGQSSYATDLYGLGLTFYELIQRKPAFQEVEPGQLIHSICKRPLAPLEGDDELVAIINKSISFEVSDRYASMKEMESDLHRYLKGEPVHARRSSGWRRYHMWIRRHPAVAIWSHAAALLVMLLFASVSLGYIHVRQALQKTEEHRDLAERNAKIADASLQRIFDSLDLSPREGSNLLGISPSRANARMMQDLLPYYEEITMRGAGNSEKLMRASRILASIDASIGDYATAEKHYRRAMELSQNLSAEALECRNGLAFVLLRQKGKIKYDEALSLLNRSIEDFRGSDDLEMQLNLLKSMQLAASSIRVHRMPPIHKTQYNKKKVQGQGRGAQYNRQKQSPNPAFYVERKKIRAAYKKVKEDRKAILAEAGILINELLEQYPHELRVRLTQLDFMTSFPLKEVNELFAYEDESALNIIKDLLSLYPDNEELMKLYVRISLRTNKKGNAIAGINLARAARYALVLLSEHAWDSEMLMQFLKVRYRYAHDLEKNGDSFGAELENERTLGILDFLTAKNEFSPLLREKLIMLVVSNSLKEPENDAHDKQLSILIKSYDEKRIKILRRRIQNLKKRSLRGWKNQRNRR